MKSKSASVRTSLPRLWRPAPPTLCVWLEWGLGGGWGLEGAGAWAWAGGGIWKKGGSPVSIHTCLPGMECIARPPGSETRAWRTEMMFNSRLRVAQTPAGGITHELNIPESLGAWAGGVLPCWVFPFPWRAQVVKRGPEVGMWGKDAWLPSEQVVGGLNQSPGEKEQGFESFKSE